MGLRVTGLTPRGMAVTLHDENEREVLLAALNSYGNACIEGVRAMVHDEEKRLEFAARYDHARAIAERVAGLG